MEDVKEVKDENAVEEMKNENAADAAKDVKDEDTADAAKDVNTASDADSADASSDENKASVPRKVDIVPPRKRIVAVDDSNMVLKTLKNVLDEDYELHVFSAGTRALEYMEEKKRIPDLIILDIEMPIMNGYDVLKRIKKVIHLRHVPVIFLTSHSEKKQVMKAVTGGVKDYVVKPIDKDILMKKVHSLLYDD